MHHKMKFSSVILVFTLAIIVVTAESWEVIDETLTNDCKSNEWILTNTTIIWKNDTKHIYAGITYNKPGGPIYKILITMDCKNYTCSTPRIYVINIDCRPNKIEDLPESDKYACMVAEEAGKREQEKEWLTNRYQLMGEKLFDIIICINLHHIQIKDDKDLESTESSKSSE
ncbi:uncharacterized protein [Linepithema humile]|uniref:uncharacterized protein n=1 Tax=Linepithema humile TaxID=83485 RepID=UPI0006238A6B|nr:PREDICTED: uncharacterized protein LOC105674057 [Linepithema humile]